jgi:hypothetical protein
MIVLRSHQSTLSFGPSCHHEQIMSEIPGSCKGFRRNARRVTLTSKFQLHVNMQSSNAKDRECLLDESNASNCKSQECDALLVVLPSHALLRGHYIVDPSHQWGSHFFVPEAWTSLGFREKDRGSSAGLRWGCRL